MLLFHSFSGLYLNCYEHLQEWKTEYFNEGLEGRQPFERAGSTLVKDAYLGGNYISKPPFVQL